MIPNRSLDIAGQFVTKINANRRRLRMSCVLGVWVARLCASTLSILLRSSFICPPGSDWCSLCSRSVGRLLPVPLLIFFAIYWAFPQVFNSFRLLLLVSSCGAVKRQPHIMWLVRVVHVRLMFSLGGNRRVLTDREIIDRLRLILAESDPPIQAALVHNLAVSGASRRVAAILGPRSLFLLGHSHQTKNPQV